MPIKTSLVAVDDMRVAVAADSLSLYVAGQEDAPLLAGELHGRLDPVRCSWTVAARAALVPGAAAAGDDDGAREIEITLRKATAADWPDSSRRGTSDRRTVDVWSDFQFRSRLRSLAL